MSKTLQATCSAGVVKVGAIPLPDATKLSKGVGASSGIAVIDEDKQYYVANTTADLQASIEKLIEVIDQSKTVMTKIQTLLNTLGTAGFIVGATAAVPWPGLALFPPEIIDLTTKIAAFDPIKASLNTLKENLK